jgi:hypothetical protein
VRSPVPYFPRCVENKDYRAHAMALICIYLYIDKFFLTLPHDIASPMCNLLLNSLGLPTLIHDN